MLHNYHHSPDGQSARSYLCGYSFVAQPVALRTDQPPSAGDWSGRGEYYRISLRDYTEIASPLDFRVFAVNYAEKLRDEIEHYLPKFYPFTISGCIVRLNQGMYLTQVTGLLYATLLDAFEVESAPIPERERGGFIRHTPKEKGIGAKLATSSGMRS